jgi:hypothetical protein
MAYGDQVVPLGKWREFTKVDWYGMAGAESFPGHDWIEGVAQAEPLIADFKVDGLDAYAILDANGVWIDILTPDGESVANGGFVTAMLGARWAARLTPVYASFTTTDLLAAGWQEERTAEDTRWCNLRGKEVPVMECVASCPAPEQSVVCGTDIEAAWNSATELEKRAMWGDR